MSDTAAAIAMSESARTNSLPGEKLHITSVRDRYSLGLKREDTGQGELLKWTGVIQKARVFSSRPRDLFLAGVLGETLPAPEMRLPSG